MDAVAERAATSPRAHSWQATPAGSRALLVIAAALLAAAVVLAGAAANATPRQQVTVVRASTPAAVTVDATGCPISAGCEVTASATPGLMAALTGTFTGATLVNQTQTADTHTGRVYRSAIEAQSKAGSIVTLASQCNPGAQSGSAYQTVDSVSHEDLAGNQVVDASTVTTVVPGGNGCTVAVQLWSRSAGASELARAQRLAHDPRAQLG